MLAELRAKSQITIPKELVQRLGLSVGDTMEIYEHDGMICIAPVTVYPKQTLEALKKEIKTAKTRIAAGEQLVFDNVDALFAELEND